MKIKYALTVGVALFMGTLVTKAQVLNRLKQKVENKTEQKAGEEIDKLFGGKKKDQASGQSGQGGANGQGGQDGSGGVNSGSGGNPSNKGGA